MNDTHANENLLTGRRVALCVTGGIAAYKAIEVLRSLQQAGCQVRVAMTKRACEFVQPLTFRALSGEHVLVDDYAPDNPDPIAHITFSQSVDLIIVAPATANIIAKFANGIADDFITSTYLAADAPVLVAPAMNTRMWQHAATVRNIAQLKSDGVHIVEPAEGLMACGTSGAGRLSEAASIVHAALEILRSRENTSSSQIKNLESEISNSAQHDENFRDDDFRFDDLHGERILITAGATREFIDPVRFISNRSSGRMGFALAEAARARGAQEVTIIAGQTSVAPPAGVRVVCVTTSDEMHRAVMDEITDSTIFIAAAAVADYRPLEIAADKIKKNGDGTLTLHLQPTTDILASVAAHPSRLANNLLVIGFAAETTDVIRHAQIKLEKKNLDFIIANDVTRDGAGFDTETNIVHIIARDTPRDSIELPLMSKQLVAHRIFDEIKRVRIQKPLDTQPNETSTQTA